MDDQAAYLGIEIGGTKLQFGVGAGDGGHFIAFERRNIVMDDGAQGILEQIREVGSSLVNQHNVARVGIGFGGPVDSAVGRTITSHQVDGWDDVPLVEWCQATLGRTAVIGNDCDVASLAEARFGAGRGRRIVFFVTVGTGIGGGLVIDGRLHGRGRPAVAEIGHLRPGPDATSTTSTIESIAAGPGIAQAARRACQRQPGDAARQLAVLSGNNLDALTAEAVATAAAIGNSVALDVLNNAVRVLGWGIAQVVTLTAAEVVVVGGGVSFIGEQHFFAPLRDQVRQYVFPPLRDAYRVVPAELGEAVVVHGALALAAAGEPRPG